MLAHCRARKIDLVAIAAHADQREIAGASADVADQNTLTVEQAFARALQIVGDPRIEGRRRLFEQC